MFPLLNLPNPMTGTTITAQTKEELVELVRKYWINYHPAGYGTTFYTGGPGWDTRSYHTSDVWDEDNPLSRVEPLEDGTYEIHVSRATHCD